MTRLHLRWLAAPLSAGALAVCPGAAADPPAPPPFQVSVAFEESSLPNGLKVILHEDPRAGVVAINLRFGVGSKDDPPGRRGMSELMRRLLAGASTRHVEGDERDELIRAVGGRAWEVEVRADADDTSISTTVPSAALDLALWLESDHMAFFGDGVNAAVLDDERKGMAEQEQRAADRPYGAVIGEVWRAVYGAAHPYGRSAVGAAELAAVTPAEARARHRAWYGPASAILTLAGDVTKDQATRLVTRYFGPIAAAPRPAAASGPAAPLAGERRIRVEADVGAPRIVLAWPTPASYQPEDPLLDEVATLLSGRLRDRIGGEQGIVTDFFVGQLSWGLGSLFIAQGTPRSGHSIDEVRAALEGEIARLQAEDPSEREALRARLQLATTNLSRVDSLVGIAQILSAFELRTGDPGGFSRYLADYQAATPASIRRAAVSQLPAGRRVVAEVLPTAGAPKAGRLAQGAP